MRGARAVRAPRPTCSSGPATPAPPLAAALLGFGLHLNVHRPAIAVPLPMFGSDRSQLLIDGGATVDPQPEWLVEWRCSARSTHV